MKDIKNQQFFFEILKAGLWEKEVRLSQYRNIDYSAVMQLAEEQSVVGLIAAGLERVVDIKIPQQWALQIAGQTIQLEQRNKAMNVFVAQLITRLREEDIYTLLVKGQGIAQCYEKPLWRASGDIDLLLSGTNYDKAKDLLLSLSSEHKPERLYSKEMGLSIYSWYVEVHGTQRTGLSMRIDKTVDDVQRDVFYGGNVRSWDNGGTQVFLPSSNNDVFFVFTHFVKHFYNEGMNLRQLCDWCRLLWNYKTEIDRSLLCKRLEQAGLMTEWNAFASLAVNYLGMPEGAMPLYNSAIKWRKKANLLVGVIINGVAIKKLKYVLSIARVFPFNTIRFSPCIIFYLNRLKVKEMLFK